MSSEQAGVSPIAREGLEPDPGPTRAASVSVLVPVTERPEALDEIYREYAPAFRSADCAFEFLFIVEPWGTELAAALDPLKEAGEPIRVLTMGQTVSEAALLRAAVERTDAPIVVTLPAYHRVTPDAIPQMLDMLNEGQDFVSARRDRSSDAWLSRLQSRAFHKLLAWGTGHRFEDIASGVRAMRREVLEEVPLYGDFFRFLPVLARREGFRVREILVPQHPKDFGKKIYAPGTYLRRLIDLMAVIFLARFTKKPLRFFGLIGSGFLFGGGVILFVLFLQRMAGQPLADRPMLLLGVLLTVLGFQALALGLIGEVIVHLHASRHRMYRVEDRERGS